MERSHVNFRVQLLMTVAGTFESEAPADEPSSSKREEVTELTSLSAGASSMVSMFDRMFATPSKPAISSSLKNSEPSEEGTTFQADFVYMSLPYGTCWKKAKSIINKMFGVTIDQGYMSSDQRINMDYTKVPRLDDSYLIYSEIAIKCLCHEGIPLHRTPKADNLTEAEEEED